jgi:hypothetical protein
LPKNESYTTNAFVMSIIGAIHRTNNFKLISVFSVPSVARKNQR